MKSRHAFDAARYDAARASRCDETQSPYKLAGHEQMHTSLSVGQGADWFPLHRQGGGWVVRNLLSKNAFRVLRAIWRGSSPAGIKHGFLIDKALLFVRGNQANRRACAVEGLL
jgi:hypothetical protein